MNKTVKTQQQLITQAAVRSGQTYTALAKQLGVSRQGLSQYRYGSPIPSAVALQLAKAAREKPEYVLACVEYNKAQRLGRADEAVIWTRIARTFRSACVAVA